MYDEDPSKSVEVKSTNKFAHLDREANIRVGYGMGNFS